jgi:hypothetical protein
MIINFFVWYDFSMNILILGGNSKRHFEWIREVKKALEPLADEIRLHDYKHWSEDSPEADVEFEILAAAQTAEGLGDYILVAKSIGTVISTLGISRGLLKPRACLFMGMPLSVIPERFPDFGNDVTKLPQTIFLQNTDDPLGNSVDLENFIEKAPPENWQLVAANHDTHDYVNMKLIAQLTQQLVDATQA